MSWLNPQSVGLAISCSGRSIDLIQSVENAKKTGAHVIAITASSSPLANEADVVLPLDIEEDSDITDVIDAYDGYLGHALTSRLQQRLSGVVNPPT